MDTKKLYVGAIIDSEPSGTKTWLTLTGVDSKNQIAFFSLTNPFGSANIQNYRVSLGIPVYYKQLNKLYTPIAINEDGTTTISVRNKD